MNQEITVHLTDKPAAAPWGEHNLISFNNSQITVHVPKNKNWPLREIQKAGRQCYNLGIPRLTLSGKNWDIDSQWAFYQGLSNHKKPCQLRFAKLPAEQETVLQAWLKVHSWAKTQINASAQEKSPRALADNAIAFLEEIAPGKISSSLIVGDDLKNEGWMGLYSVGKGSDRPPVMAVIDYNPKKNKTVPTAAALVGKGICFDSGGYSLKQTESMSNMKNDMGGAATVCAALGLAILQGLKKRVQIILCCAENLVSGHAYKLGDIIHYKNGISVEVVNTDAEGRLVLADGLIKASETGAPLIIDAATLTGAAVVAVGMDYTALFALDADLRSRTLDYAAAQHELVWPMPLETWHRDQVPSYYADTANSRKVPMGGPSGASNAAGFLSRFVPNDGKGWLHFDLANAFQNDASALFGAGATGASIKTIAETLLKEVQ
ncbi:MAG: aminopeptidase [Gammaproteobacteria bacterium]|jgi:PepB aminopeptidase|nr:aminopeptidase [Gammaproteobacteria bacterium]